MEYEVLGENFGRHLLLLMAGWLVAMFIAGMALIVFGDVIYG